MSNNETASGNVTANTTESGDLTSVSTDGKNGVSIALEPSERTAEVGESTRYEIVVKNANKPISAVMTADPVTAEPTAELDRLIELLADEERDINRLPVVIDEGFIVGIVTRQDVLRALRDHG